LRHIFSMKKALLFFVSILFSVSVSAQYSGALPGYKVVSGGNWVKAKNYYLLTLLQSNNEVRTLLKNDPALNKLAQHKLSALTTAIRDCKDALCLPAAVKFTDEEISTVSERLTSLYKPGNALDKLVKTQLIPSGAYMLYQAESPANLLAKAWQQDAAAVNFTIGVMPKAKSPTTQPLILFHLM
jgi:hypothetical protein